MLLADVTSALDVSTQADILALLRTLQQRPGLAVLFIAHELAVVESVGTDVTVLLEALWSSKALSSVLGAPMRVYTETLISSVPSLSGEPGGAAAETEGRPDPMTNETQPVDSGNECRHWALTDASHGRPDDARSCDEPTHHLRLVTEAARRSEAAVGPHSPDAARTGASFRAHG